MNVSDPHRLELLTEDSVSFSVRLATPFARALAIGIDMIVIVGIQAILQIPLRLLAALDADTANGLGILLFFASNFAYFLFCEWGMAGQTYGKRILGLRVMDAQARRLVFSQVLVRTLFRVIDMFPVFYAVGGIASLLNPRFQRLGDIAAGTVVIRIPDLQAPLPGELKDRKYNSFRAHPQVEALLRRNTLPEEAVLLLESLHRRSALEPGARAKVFQQLACHFQKRTRFPSDLVDNLGDEAFLLNCLDTLTRNQREL